MSRKVCVVVTARPSYSRIRTALTCLQETEGVILQLVVAASALLDRYGSVINEIERDGFKIDKQALMVLEGESAVSMAKTTGLGIIELASAFDDLKPDIVVTVADRYETIATAIAAAYMNIPLAHIQGGEITGTIDEKVRHSITKLSDLHLVSTDQARENVIRMGEFSKNVYVTGCPSIDIAKSVLEDPAMDFCPFQKYGGVGAPVDIEDPYLVVMQHPVTTELSEARAQINETLYAVSDAGMPTFWFWPNVDAGSDGISKGLRAFREHHPDNNIHFFKNMSPTDFLKLLYNSRCLIGNSSAGIRECSYLSVPVVNIGSRQAYRERGNNVIDVAYDRVEIAMAINQSIQNGRPTKSEIYGSGNAGQRIAETLASCKLTISKRLNYI